jgi:hypothetical protein
MKAIIKICVASKEFRADQIQIMRRVCNALIAHDLSVSLEMKQKKYKEVKLKLVK